MELKRIWTRGAGALLVGAALGASLAGVVATQPITALAQEGDYAPIVRTTDDGVQYQLSPSEEGNPQRLNKPVDIKPYNTYWLNSDERGCESCHENLGEFVENMPNYTHLGVIGAIDDMTVTQCNYCHVGHSSSQPKAEMFGSIMHSIHGIGVMGEGSDMSCWSCHDANENGEGIVLWDEVKYDRMIGFTNIAAEDLDALTQFEYDQERVTPTEDIFDVGWQISDYDRLRENPLPENLEDEVFDNWTIEISGAVDNPSVFKLTDLIDQGLSVTQKICIQCVDNPTGGGLLAQMEVTGIPLTTLFDMAGMQDDANIFIYEDASGAAYYSVPTELLYTGTDALLVYEINGERLSMQNGYPVYGVIGGYEAYYSVKQVVGIQLVAEEREGHYSQDGLNYSNTPNIGELDTHEGQIIAAGEPYTFGGYAYAYNNPITGVEFSMDRGQSWVHYDIENADFNKWVSWYWTFTPEAGKDTAYVLSMRAVMGDGEYGEVVEKFVNAKAEL